MFNRNFILRAAEFKQKSRWSSVWPNMRYGSMFLSYSVGRKLPMKGVNWVTRDSNRLLNFSNRYSAVISDIDVKRTEEELNVALSDIRWNDHRRIYWKCSFCGSSYRKNVSVRTKYHAGCNFCKKKYPSEVRGEQHGSPPVSQAAPELTEQLVDNGKRDNLATLAVTSKFYAEWTCRGCGGSYRSTIRSRTGQVEAGQCTLHPDIVAWSAYCPSCSWRPNMVPIAEEVSRSGQFLGLERSMEELGGQRGKQLPIPRRKRLAC
ncbi:protein of unknown function (DUF4379), putative [Trypanosoma equiperdum]|uniref:Treble clef zinc finger domain-containing protein n=4 Tax=Trypanozoon TaxID=39700 RepID=Q388L7_TRYB2|nr:hypothetical protein, conserved [Trypanosoma brucei gambiense DAL972]XP_827865.1 hypothetical protein, conserved [Trypanosoma brucei brucei TREU927]6HIV_DS Chain DS, ms66 [Trypanosoma brucei brucei]6HIW_DS Chain DS, mS66 [Trypanosoma brucei brucei]6HIY_DS Chain DS, mS66 [Trypanosoma brucei brucei]7PUB_DS Chain DS, mS66 [Trypanosoma brucei brucei]RHW69286.1 hypothetical protein DPX39_100144400 [Trypanosoma brucei equiperdum]SCU69555.1 Domain of unknown function (DUF4379), putative [Trypano|eukprot:XP_011778860.1 hypothetical protein, conserved [Trypanosoma brucei gambiense DAL972]